MEKNRPINVDGHVHEISYLQEINFHTLFKTLQSLNDSTNCFSVKLAIEIPEIPIAIEMKIFQKIFSPLTSTPVKIWNSNDS